jgi:hypothetical protein
MAAKQRVTFVDRFGKVPGGTIRSIAQRAAACFDQVEQAKLQVVLEACIASPMLFPPPRAAQLTIESFIQYWVSQYHVGYVGRPSRAVGRPVGTIADQAIDVVVEAALKDCNPTGLVRAVSLVREAHRLAMSAENLIGGLLEEYIADETADLGWSCCWGRSVQSVDFVHRDGRLLQVKNRSNSENSSSSRVRRGTSIQKWHRVDAINGRTNWRSLGEILGDTRMSEQGFQAFIRGVLRLNPRVINLSANCAALFKA